MGDSQISQGPPCLANNVHAKIVLTIINNYSESVGYQWVPEWARQTTAWSTAATSSPSCLATASVPPSVAAAAAGPNHAGTCKPGEAGAAQTGLVAGAAQAGSATKTAGAAGRPEEARTSTMQAPCGAPAQPAPDSHLAAPTAINARSGGEGAGEEESEGVGAGEGRATREEAEVSGRASAGCANQAERHHRCA